MNTKQGQRTAGEWLTAPDDEGSYGFIYMLNSAGVNKFSASISAGRNDDDSRVSVAESRAAATKLAFACNSYDSNMATIARLTEALEGLIAAEERFEDDTGIELDDLITDALVVAKSALASASQPEQKEGA